MWVTIPPAAAPTEVTVVVPVYNTGPALRRCVDSILAQTMDASRYDVVLVDDGSTDESPALLDAVAAAHPHVRVIHQQNSGWPGKPRNVGIDAARGAYVLFLDHDDSLGPEALERLTAFAVRNGSDIVIPRVVGVGRAGSTFGSLVLDRVPPENPVIFSTLTPHKLFRTAFLREHGIRFPEGRRRLEDHAFVFTAYFVASVISICGDYPAYYHYDVAGHGNAASGRFDPSGGFDPAYYYRFVREALDIVEARSQPGPMRDAALRRYMNRELFVWLGSERLLRLDQGRREVLIAEVSEIVRRYVPASIDPTLPTLIRVQAHLVRSGRTDLLVPLARFESRMTARAAVKSVAPIDGDGWRITGTASMLAGGRPIALERHGNRFLLPVPAAVAAAVPAEVRALVGGSPAVSIVLRRRQPPMHASIAATTLRRDDGARSRTVVTFTADVQPDVLADTAGPSGAMCHAVAQLSLGKIRRETPLVRPAGPGRVRPLAFAGGQPVKVPAEWSPHGPVRRIRTLAARAYRRLRA